jgi:hypothetical protein
VLSSSAPGLNTDPQSAADGIDICDVIIFPESDYVLTSELWEFEWEEDGDERSWCRGVVFRVQGNLYLSGFVAASNALGGVDGNCSQPFNYAILGFNRCVRSNVLCTAEPVRDQPFDTGDIVDAVTGRRLKHMGEGSLVDTSGAHIWHEPGRGLFGSSTPGASAFQLLGAIEFVEARSVCEFRFGVLVVRVSDCQYRVLRFDGDALLESRHKVERWRPRNASR